MESGLENDWLTVAPIDIYVFKWYCQVPFIPNVMTDTYLDIICLFLASLIAWVLYLYCDIFSCISTIKVSIINPNPGQDHGGWSGSSTWLVWLSNAPCCSIPTPYCSIRRFTYSSTPLEHRGTPHGHKIPHSNPSSGSTRTLELWGTYCISMLPTYTLKKRKNKMKSQRKQQTDAKLSNLGLKIHMFIQQIILYVMYVFWLVERHSKSVYYNHTGTFHCLIHSTYLPTSKRYYSSVSDTISGHGKRYFSEI